MEIQFSQFSAPVSPGKDFPDFRFSSLTSVFIFPPLYPVYSLEIYKKVVFKPENP